MGAFFLVQERIRLDLQPIDQVDGRLEPNSNK